MGSRGYGPGLAVLLGGVSRRVTMTARCPVLVVPRGSTSALAAWARHGSGVQDLLQQGCGAPRGASPDGRGRSASATSSC